MLTNFVYWLQKLFFTFLDIIPIWFTLASLVKSVCITMSLSGEKKKCPLDICGKTTQWRNSYQTDFPIAKMALNKNNSRVEAIKCSSFHLKSVSQ